MVISLRWSRARRFQAVRPSVATAGGRSAVRFASTESTATPALMASSRPMWRSSIARAKLRRSSSSGRPRARRVQRCCSRGPTTEVKRSPRPRLCRAAMRRAIVGGRPSQLNEVAALMPCGLTTASSPRTRRWRRPTTSTTPRPGQMASQWRRSQSSSSRRSTVR